MSELPRVVGIFGNRGGGTSAIAGVVHLLGMPYYGKPKTLDDNDLMYAENRQTLIEERNALGDWMFKHPLLTPHIDQIKGFIPQLKCIYVFRDPVATSSHGSSKSPLELITDDWEFQKHMLNDKQGLYISYERAITNREETVNTIAQYLKLPVNDAAVAWLDPALKYRDISDYE